MVKGGLLRYTLEQSSICSLKFAPLPPQMCGLRCDFITPPFPAIINPCLARILF